MEMAERVREELRIENGLTIYFVDESRPIVGGRSQVQLRIRVPIEARAGYFENFPNPSEALQEFTSLAGNDTIEFQVVKVRNFIDDNQVEETLDRMKDEFMKSALDYVKKSGFAASFVLRKYEELRRERSLRDARTGGRQES